MVGECPGCRQMLLDAVDRCPSCGCTVRGGPGAPAVMLDGARFADAAVRMGVVTVMQVIECQQLLATREFQGKMLPDALVAKGYLTTMQAIQIATEFGSAQAPAVPAAPSTPEIQGYEPLRSAGEDRTGLVYRSIHRGTRRDVELRLFEIPSTGAELERAMPSLRRLTFVEHPGLSRLLDVGCSPGHFYFATAPAEGRPLSAALSQQPLMSEERVRALARQMAGGLQKLLEERLCHFGLSAETVLVAADGSARLAYPALGFLLHDVLPALVKRLQPPEYQAPEQLEGEVGSIRSDIYALGVLLQQCATGRTPSDQKSGTMSGISPALAQLIASMLEKEPSRRLASPAKVVELLG